MPEIIIVLILIIIINILFVEIETYRVINIANIMFMLSPPVSLIEACKWMQKVSNLLR